MDISKLSDRYLRQQLGGRYLAPPINGLLSRVIDIPSRYGGREALEEWLRIRPFITAGYIPGQNGEPEHAYLLMFSIGNGPVRPVHHQVVSSSTGYLLINAGEVIEISSSGTRFVLERHSCLPTREPCPCTRFRHNAEDIATREAEDTTPQQEDDLPGYRSDDLTMDGDSDDESGDHHDTEHPEFGHVLDRRNSNDRRQLEEWHLISREGEDSDDEDRQREQPARTPTQVSNASRPRADSYLQSLDSILSLYERDDDDDDEDSDSDSDSDVVDFDLYSDSDSDYDVHYGTEDGYDETDYRAFGFVPIRCECGCGRPFCACGYVHGCDRAEGEGAADSDSQALDSILSLYGWNDEDEESGSGNPDSGF